MDASYVMKITKKVTELMEEIDKANKTGNKMEVGMNSLGIDCFLKALLMACECELEGGNK